MPQNPQDVVESFCRYVGEKNMTEIEKLFDDDIVYQNNGMPPARGVPAAVEALQYQFDNLGEVQFKIVNIAVNGDRVLTERIDVLTPGGTYAPIPVSGTFVVRHGKIVHWRDYFDTALTQKMMAGEDTSAVAFSYDD